jgi:hypothetical protein
MTSPESLYRIGRGEQCDNTTETTAPQQPEQQLEVIAPTDWWSRD